MTGDAWSWLGAGGGEAAAVIRKVDWADTAVGPVATWPAQLKSILSMMLYARHPMFLWWGPELIQFYNDGYTPSFGVGRHPAAMGQRGEVCWAEIWPIIGPEIAGVMARREGTFHEDALVPILRNDRTEEVYWTYGYSPVFDEHGAVAGVLVVVTETTTRVLAMRRLNTARRLAEMLTLAQTTSDLVQRVVRALEGAQEDVPWALAVGAARSDVLAQTHNLPSAVSEQVMTALDGSDASFLPIELRLDGLPGGPWPEPCTRAIVLPLRASKEEAGQGVLVLGLSPRLPYDLSYEQHLRDILRLLDEAAERLAAGAARAAAERSRDDLLLQAPVAAALLVGPEWVFELANRAYVELVGREVLGRTWLQCFPELVGSETEAVLQRVYQRGEPVLSAEQLIPLVRDGVAAERYFDFNMVPVRRPGGEVEAMMVIAVELTTQVRARRDLERAAVEREKFVGELQAASRSKDEFVAMLSHELRNPLAPISTALGLLEMRGVQGIEREREVITRQVQHLTRLVDDLLDVARLASHKVKLSLRVVDVAKVVAQAIELATPLLEERAQRVRVLVPKGFHVCGDEGRLTQVFTNLLTNAAKYSNAHTEILVQAERREDHVVIRVRDRGTGIDSEMLPRVFDLFSQERQSLARSAGGLGLGLAIVRSLVVMHGGTVFAESAGRDQGSTFTVELPLTGDEATTEATREGAVQLPASGVRRVLIVDDNDDAADLLALALTDRGHITCVAPDGPTALSLVEAFHPDLALLDIGLPVMDGYELAQHLRARPDGAVLEMYALTGYGQESDRRRAQSVGFDGHFVKPLDLRTLVQTVEQRLLR